MRHHLPDDLLAEHAAGTLSPAAELLVAAHLTLCPECLARSGEIEGIAGAMLDALPAEAMSAGALDRALAQLDQVSAPADEAPAATDLPVTDGLLLPRPLRRRIGADIDALAWRRLVRGIETVPLDIDAGDGGCMLLRARPAATLPRHTHEGIEMTLVLSGSYSDEGGRFGRGDVQISDGEVDHRLTAGPEEPCLCLIVLDGALRLSGPAGRLLNPFIR